MLKIRSSLPAELERTVHDVVGCCLAVHREQGPGFLGTSPLSTGRGC
jgi:hypothetical protein